MRSHLRTGLARILVGTAAVLLVTAASTMQAVGDDKDIASGVGGPPTIRKLTQDQYRNIIADTFGTDIALGGRFEPDVRASGLIAVGTGRSSVTASGIEQFDRMGRTIADQVVDARHRDSLLPCKPVSAAAPDDKCAAKVLSQTGEILFRRPLTADELNAYVQAANTAARQAGGFYRGLSLSLGALLTAPQFLYRLDATEKDPRNPGRLRLTDYALAERISFFLWDTAPDPQLLAAAKSHALSTPKGLQRQVDRMLASPRLESGMRAFFSDMLQFDTFDALAKDSANYPKFSFAASQEAREQTLRTVIDLLVRGNGDYRDLFTTRKTELTTRLGSLYGVAVAPPDGNFDAWVPYEFAESSGHSGILTQASFVGLHSHPARTSPTIRGKALREILMCETVPDPPGNVDFKLVQDTTNAQFKTVRQRLNAHATEAMCKGCHKITDPIGLGLENFDTIGGFRTTENGAPIDAAGVLDGVSYVGAQGLGKALHDNPNISACLVKKMYEYSVGREPSAAERAWLTGELGKQFAADGYRATALMRDIALSDAFSMLLAPAPQVKADQASLTQHKPLETNHEGF